MSGISCSENERIFKIRKCLLKCCTGLKKKSDLEKHGEWWRLLGSDVQWQTPSSGFNILPSTTAVFSYAIGSRKLSANEQFFVGAQTVVSLLQTTEIKQSMSFIAANKVYTSRNKTTIVWIEMELFFKHFLPGVDASHVYVGALALGCFYSHISTGTFWRALTTSLDSCVEVKSAPSVV